VNGYTKCAEASAAPFGYHDSAMSFARIASVKHGLQPHYRALRAIRTRKALERSALWGEIGAELRRVLDAVERGDRPSNQAAEPRPPPRAPGLVWPFASATAIARFST
jgi:hypothetical protein